MLVRVSSEGTVERDYYEIVIATFTSCDVLCDALPQTLRLLPLVFNSELGQMSRLVRSFTRV